MTPRYLFAVLLACAAQGAFAQAALPFTLERFALPGPLAGVLVKVDLTDPRASIELALADDRDPDGDGPCVGLLDTVTSAAKRHDYAVTINASFFATPTQKTVNGKNYSYVVGNCAYPVGWQYSAGRLVGAPKQAGIRATVIVHNDGRISMEDALQELPSDTRYAVSGSAMVLKAGKITSAPDAGPRHPRSAVGISEDGRTLLIVAVDGRQEGHSRGATLGELGELLHGFGAWQAVNLDGGGSTAMAVKDPAIGTYSLANRPSDMSTLRLPVANERPVMDVIGVRVKN